MNSTSLLQYIVSAVLSCLLLVSASLAADRPKIAIIIDDLGYQLELGIRATELPGPVACAVLPGTPRAVLLATAANDQGKEVLLHLPLQAMDNQEAVEPGGLVLDMTRAEFADAFAQNIASIPHISGVNTHRGSLLTRHPGHMAWLMEEIERQDSWFFVDSYTTHESIAFQLAKESGIPAARRDVFLDSDRGSETVAREFARAKRLAREQGAVIVIGHPYPETMDLLERELPLLEEAGFDLVRVRELLVLPAGATEEISVANRNLADDTVSNQE